MHPLKNALSCALALVSLAAVGTSSFAQTTYTDDTTISSDTTLNQDLSVTHSATLTVTGATLTAGSNEYALIGGDLSTTGTGTLSLSNGGRLSDYFGALGYLSGSEGTATVNGSNSAWINSFSFFVGREGTGSLSVSAGATISASSSLIGYAAGSSGTATLTGSGTAWNTSDDIAVGQSGTGQLTVSAGAAVSSSYATIGGFSGAVGIVTLTGAGTVWSNTSGSFIVGKAGTGTLTLADSATLETNSFTLAKEISSARGTLNYGAAAGDAAAAAGILNLTSNRTISNIDPNHDNGDGVPIPGKGTVQFNTTGTVSAPTYFTTTNTAGGAALNTAGDVSVIHTAGVTNIPGTLAGTGTLTVNGGTLTLSGTNTYTGATTINGGTALVDGSLTASAVTVNTGATLGGTGTFGALATITNGGHLAPGNSPGTITFSAGLTLNEGAVLDLQLGANSDLIDVTGGVLTGSANTGGITINLTDAGGFTADTYVLINYMDFGSAGLELDDFVLGTTIENYDYEFIWGVDGSSLVLVATAVPEPATWATLAGGVVLAGALVRRGRRRMVVE